MSEREGPRTKYECFGCKHYESKRYVVQGDSGYDKWCKHPDVLVKLESNRIPEYDDTPAWCPLMPPSFKDGHEAGAADMRERAAAYVLERHGAEGPKTLAAGIRALPLAAPSAGVPVDETTKGGSDG